MKCKHYRIEVGEGFIGYSHGGTYTIDEYYIPKLNVAFNYTGQVVHIFTTTRDRYGDAQELAEVEIPNELYTEIKEHVESKETTEAAVRAFCEEHNK